MGGRLRFRVLGMFHPWADVGLPCCAGKEAGKAANISIDSIGREGHHAKDMRTSMASCLRPNSLICYAGFCQLPCCM